MEERFMGPLWREWEQSVMTSTSLSAFGHFFYKARINASVSDMSRLQTRGCTRLKVIMSAEGWIRRHEIVYL
jgi:hypothetical protein